MSAALYETDFVAWTAEQAELLRTGRLDELDTVNLLDEILDMGGSQRSALRSYIQLLLTHLLKWKLQPERVATHPTDQSPFVRSRSSWQSTIIKSRKAIHTITQNSPSLRPTIPVVIADEYETARELAAVETGLPLSRVPETCPFTVEQVLDKGWLPLS